MQQDTVGGIFFIGTKVGTPHVSGESNKFNFQKDPCIYSECFTSAAQNLHANFLHWPYPTIPILEGSVGGTDL